MSIATAPDQLELGLLSLDVPLNLDAPLNLDVPLSLDELTAEALAADPDVPVAADAVPFGADAEAVDGLLPSWYMPGPVTYRRRPSHRIAALTVIASFLVINAFGLCITYGHLVPA